MKMYFVYWAVVNMGLSYGNAFEDCEAGFFDWCREGALFDYSCDVVKVSVLRVMFGV